MERSYRLDRGEDAFRLGEGRLALG